MVDLSGSSDPFQQSIPNVVFYVPAVIVFGLAAHRHQQPPAKMEDEIISEEQILDKTIEMGSGFVSPDGQGGFKLPSLQEVMDLIDKMEDISDEERETLKSSLIFPDEEGAAKLRQQFESTTAGGRLGPSANDYILFFAMLALVALVFALFGYKLYKSLMEKQLKKQEKQKTNKKSKKTKQK